MASNESHGSNASPEGLSESQDISQARPDALNVNNSSLPSSTPLEMSTLESHSRSNPEAEQETSSPSVPPPNTDSSDENQQPSSNSAAVGPPSSTPQDPLQTVNTNATTSSTVDRKVSTAIGPSSDQPTPIAKDTDVSGPSLIITLLLTTGARHPFRIDEKYLKKRNVSVTDNDAFNMSVYTLKELIWREWREGMSSPIVLLLNQHGQV